MQTETQRGQKQGEGHKNSNHPLLRAYHSTSSNMDNEQSPIDTLTQSNKEYMKDYLLAQSPPSIFWNALLFTPLQKVQNKHKIVVFQAFFFPLLSDKRPISAQKGTLLTKSTSPTRHRKGHQISCHKTTAFEQWRRMWSTCFFFSF